jgi:hypothetical protein
VGNVSPKFDWTVGFIAGEIGIDGGDAQGVPRMLDYAESNEKTTVNLTVIATPPFGQRSSSGKPLLRRSTTVNSDFLLQMSK